MAIKGKGKTKGRQASRAPRRAPIEVKPPFFLRRRVQVSLAFVAGLLLMVFAVWVTNYLRQQRADDKAATQAATQGPKQRAAGQKWKSQVEGALGRVGTLSPGAPPALFPDLATTIAALQKGHIPDGAAATLKKARADAKAALDPLKAYKLTDSVRDIGMDAEQVSWFLNSQTRIVEALELYEQVAANAALAIDAPDDQRAAIADGAAAIQDRASEILQDGWTDYNNALGSVQIVQSPPLTSLTGPTGA
jgi:hypothetical protein